MMTKEKALQITYFLFEKETKRDIEPLKLEVVNNNASGRRAFSVFISRSEKDCPNRDARDVISAVGSTEEIALNNLYEQLKRLIGDEFCYVQDTIETLEFLLAENKTRLIKLQQLKQETTT